MTGVGIGPGLGMLVGGGAAAGPYSPLTTSAKPTTTWPGPIPDPQESISFPHGSHLSRTKSQPFSAGIWFKAAGGVIPVFNKRSNSPNNGWTMQVGPFGDFAASVKGNAHSGDSLNRGINGPFQDSVWRLLGFTWDGSNTIGGLLTYRNGVFTSSTTSGSPISGIIENTAPVSMSYEPSYGYGDWPCTFCHCFFADRVITPAEWTAIYGTGVPQFLVPILGANLKLWSTLGDGCGVGAGNMIDLSTFANHGTANNMEAGDFVADVPP
jgi:hypothetical protein